MSNNLIIRSVTQYDEDTLWQMLYYAAHMDDDDNQTIANAKTDPFLCRYVEQWGQKDDLGFIAEIDRRAVGAVWIRQFDNEDYPELAIAIAPDMIGKGIGTQLMNHIIDKSRGQLSVIMLTVRADNPAYKLYQRLGFETVREIVNRVGTVSYEMHLKR